MKRWKAPLAGLLMLAGCLTAGCKQKFMTECDYNHYHRDLGLPRELENNPHATLVPDQRNTAAPTTVNDPERPLRYMSLAEAIAIALEQGNTGSQSALFPGIANDALLQFNGRFVGASDSIRVLALDPAIAGTDIEASLAKFDARWLSSATWQKTDEAVGNILQNFQNGDNATISSGIYKPLATGGLAGITLSTQYNFLTQPPFATTNPTYRPRTAFVFEQPLLQNFGVEINQLAVSHPGSVTVPGLRASGGGRVEGVLIARLRYDQSQTEFQRNVAFMLLNVEFAYWNLYGSYFTLFSREQGLRQAFESWKLNDARFKAGAIKQQDLEQTRAQYELFRAQRIQAMGDVLDRERQLRGLLGLPIEDGTRIVPSDQPILASYTPDWNVALNECMQMRPELLLARQDLKFRQLDMILQKNFLKPDLRFTASYDINGLGTRLDGSAIRSTDPINGTIPGNALSSFADNEFNTWSMGLRLDVPIGNRDAYASVRTARLNLTRSYYQLKDQQDKAERFLAFQYRQIAQRYAEIQANRAQREANARQLELRFQEFRVGRGTLDVLLEAQRNFADSLSSEFNSIVNYNNALCGFQFAKGTLMQYDNVQIADGPLPACAQVRAVEHQRQRTLALVARERPAVQLTPGDDPVASLPALQSANMAMPTANPNLNPAAPAQPLKPAVPANEPELLPNTPAVPPQP